MPALQKEDYTPEPDYVHLVDNARREDKPIKVCIRHVMLIAQWQPCRPPSLETRPVYDKYRRTAGLGAQCPVAR